VIESWDGMYWVPIKPIKADTWQGEAGAAISENSARGTFQCA
jgi:hypothetical protein